MGGMGNGGNPGIPGKPGPPSKSLPSFRSPLGPRGGPLLAIRLKPEISASIPCGNDPSLLRTGGKKINISFYEKISINDHGPVINIS